MSEKEKYVVVIKAKGKLCQLCYQLAPKLSEIEQKLKTYGYKLLVYEVEKMFTDLGDNYPYPKSLGYKGMWYPFIFSVNGKTWKEIKAGNDRRQQLNIVAGKFNSTIDRYELTDRSFNPLNIDNLIRGIVQKDKEQDQTNIDRTEIDSSVLHSSVVHSNPARFPANQEIEINKLNLIPRRKFGYNGKYQ